MNIYRFTGTCSVCGGEGAATARTAWSATAVHSNPEVCRSIIAANRSREERETEQRERADRARVDALAAMGITEF